jgi:DNA-binding response OmpR family regulator
MKLSTLSDSDLKAKHGRLLAAACKVWAEIERREGTESMPSQINRLRGKQRDFLLALWQAPKKRMTVVDIEKKVWGDEWVERETFRKLMQRLESSIEKQGISLFIDSVFSKNGDVVGYKIKRKK